MWKHLYDKRIWKICEEVFVFAKIFVFTENLCESNVCVRQEQMRTADRRICCSGQNLNYIRENFTLKQNELADYFLRIFSYYEI